MAVIIQKRRDPAATWTMVNPILAEGEEGFELDTGKSKVGDGTTAWTSLPYISSGGGSMTAEEIRDELETLTAGDRLDASAIQNLPTPPADTDDLSEGSTNLYFTAARVLVVVLTGLSTATNAAITATDSILVALGKLQAQITGLLPSKNFIVAASDTLTPVTTGLKETFRMPYAITLSNIRASLTTAQSSGSIFTIDVKKNGTSIFSTKLTIDNSAKTSATATTPPVISTPTFADDDEVTIHVDQVGNGTAVGLKITFIVA